MTIDRTFARALADAGYMPLNEYVERYAMSEKHRFTPGPWHVEDGEDGAYVVSDDANGFSICQRAPWEHRSHESRANAQLIAAAPEMLAALQALVSCCEAHPAFTNPSNTITSGRMDAARAAISKATGSAP